MLRVGSLFSGIGGLELGLERAGMQVAFQAEYNKQARSVLARHWPDVHRYEDVHDVSSRSQYAGRQGSGEYIEGPEPDVGRGQPNPRDPDGAGGANNARHCGPVDVICGGFPCQDYSVAGKRGGLAGDRGALWWEMHRIVAEYRPTWVVGENVSGLLSSNGGADFRTIIASLVQLGYGVTWATMDSQYFGVAQRRRRLFIIGHSGGVPRPEILAISEGLFGHPAPSRKAGEGTAGRITPCLNASGSGVSRSRFNGEERFTVYERHDQDGRVKDLGDGPTPTLSAEADNGCDLPIVLAGDGANAEITHGLSPTLTARQFKDAPIAFHHTSVHYMGASPPGLGPTLKVGSGIGITGTASIAQEHTIPRRLTPKECERLQGFPDDWTRYYADGTEVADGPRYRMLGNAVTVNVAEWIGRRIMESGA